MEQKKFDFNSIIGFALIFIIILWMMYNNRQDEVKEQAKAKQKKQYKPKPRKKLLKMWHKPSPIRPWVIRLRSKSYKEL